MYIIEPLLYGYQNLALSTSLRNGAVCCSCDRAISSLCDLDSYSYVTRLFASYAIELFALYVTDPFALCVAEQIALYVKKANHSVSNQVNCSKDDRDDRSRSKEK